MPRLVRRDNQRVFFRPAILGILLLLPILACNLPTESAGPTVFIVSPSNGETVVVGQQVLIQSSASDAAGISRVDLIVDSVVVRADPPVGGSAPAVAIAQPWFPQVPGDVVVQVIAYNAQGQASAPASITLHVVEVAADVTPTPPAPTQTPVPDVTGEGGCTLNASFVADLTIPDGSKLQPGVSFIKTWRIRNPGTCAWGTGFQLVFVGGSQLGAPASVSVPATASGGSVDLSVPMVAPAAPGTYRGNWRMQSNTGQAFGSVVYVLIIVPSPVTNTPQATSTPTSTATLTPTSTEIPPAAPANLVLSVLPSGYVSFVWVDHAADEEGFYVLADGAIHATLGPDSQEYGFQTGDYFCDQTVQITIVAYRGGVRSAPSNAVEYIGPPCPPPILVQASGLLMGASSYLDLDTGGLGGYTGDVDLLWESNGSYRLVGMNGMRFSSMGVGPALPSYAGCFAAPMDLEEIYVPELQAGSQLCLTTTEGNLAGLRVDEVQPDYDLVVSYVTWAGTP